jgi:hypothetical protein
MLSYGYGKSYSGTGFALSSTGKGPMSGQLESTFTEEIMDPKCDSSSRIGKLEGKYANHLAVGYNAYEFIFDFGQSYSESGHAELYTRIIICPAHAKELLKILSESVAQYEKEFGPDGCK